MEVRLRRDRLVISNPGGLYGITVDRLGKESVTSARNARLVAIRQYVHIDTGISFTVILHPARRQATTRPSLNSTELRVYDALASGQKTIAELQALLGLQPANLRKVLRSLRTHGLVQQHTGQGQTTWYQRSDISR